MTQEQNTNTPAREWNICVKYWRRSFISPYNSLASELIFQPLKMNDTRYVWDKNIDTTRLAIGYDKNGKAYETVKHMTPKAADDLLTTIEDYRVFLVSVMNGDGLTKEVFEEMNSNQVASTKGKHFGLGFEIYHLDNGAYALSHGGAYNGVQTIVFILPKSKQGLLIFTNVGDGNKVYEKLLTHYLGENGTKIFNIETK